MNKNIHKLLDLFTCFVYDSAQFLQMHFECAQHISIWVLINRNDITENRREATKYVWFKGSKVRNQFERTSAYVLIL